jgi:PAS domain S-box-containing protein
MLDFSYDGIWITDGNGKVLYVNSANLSLLGVNEDLLINKTTSQLLNEKIISDSVILDVIREKRQISKTCYNYNTNLTVLATATPIFNNDGSIKYIFNNVRDITLLSKLQNTLLDKENLIRLQDQMIEDTKDKLGTNNIIANSKTFFSTIQLAKRIASFDGSTVIILGESGTGKELISSLIVENSQRKDKPYLQVNCGAIPENLIESELFGYEKGSFTGADSQGRKGLFESANGGTVFLDEIGDLPLHLQGKLLRVLQQKSVTRIGRTTPIDVDVRIIAATNCDLEKMVAEKLFREDLYYRLNVVTIKLPPLRERKDDIIPLLYHFLKIINKKYNVNKTLAPETIEVLKNYKWPGNIRELENLVENLVITSQEDIITKDNLPAKLIDNTLPKFNIDIMPLKQAVELFENELIERAVMEFGSIRQAAIALDVNSSTISRKMQKLNTEK